MNYAIKRFYYNGASSKIKEVETLQEAQEWCKDPQTSSKTIVTPKTRVRTKSLERKHKKNPWFDGYVEVTP